MEPGGAGGGVFDWFLMVPVILIRYGLLWVVTPLPPAAGDINAGRAKPRDFDATLATIHSTVGTGSRPPPT